METNNGLVLTGQEKDVSTNQISAFAGFVQAGIDSWRKAGELLVEMIDADPLARKKVMRQCPSISMDILVAFERIGRKQVFPKLLLDASPGSRRLLTLPYVMQEKYCTEKVQVLLQWKPANPHYMEKHVQSLTSMEVEQVFGPAGARTLQEQHEFITAKQRAVKPLRTSNRVSASGLVHPEKLQSVGYYKIVIVRGEPQLIKVEGEHPYAMPIELTSTSDSEPFEIIHLVK